MTADEKIKKAEHSAIVWCLIGVHVLVGGGYGICYFLGNKATAAYFVLAVMITSFLSMIIGTKAKYVYTPTTFVFFTGILFSAFLGVPFISVLLISFVSFILTLINFS